MQKWYCQKPLVVKCVVPVFFCDLITKALDGNCCNPFKGEYMKLVFLQLNKRLTLGKGSRLHPKVMYPGWMVLGTPGDLFALPFRKQVRKIHT